MANLKSQQILVPMQVFIGDDAELRCTFNSNSSAIKKLIDNSKDGSVELTISDFEKPIESSEYDISQITLELKGVDFYQLQISFNPWKVGKIQFPSINIADEILDFSPIQIMSIVEQTNTSSLKESISPLLLPNTSYKILGFIIAFVVFILLMIRIFMKRNKIHFFINSQKIKYRNKKNRTRTIKVLQKLLLQEEINDIEFAENFQQIMRRYLQIHFDYPFSNCVTSQMEEAFSIISKNLFSVEKNESFMKLVSFFVRTDYIRFSGKGICIQNERQEIIESTKKIIQVLERTDD